jgi:hypothetical protein
MSLTRNNRIHKGTSLLIKALILILSSWYILHKLTSAGPRLHFISVASHYVQVDFRLLLFAGLLMFLNWGIEALKWKILIASLEEISFKTAMQSVFAGVTVSIFMPNRIGEFAGRIFFLEKADKIEATLKNFVGSLSQLFMTLVIGIIAVSGMARLPGGGAYLQGIPDKSMGILIIAVVLTGLAILLMNRYRERFPARIRSYFKAIFDIRRKELLVVFLLSFLRYCVFLFQYYLVLQAFGIIIGLYTASVLIAVTFLATSVIPSFALTEVVTRGAVASSLFAAVAADPATIITASLVVWIINLAIPAIIGTAFTWKLKFFGS